MYKNAKNVIFLPMFKKSLRWWVVSNTYCFESVKKFADKSIDFEILKDTSMLAKKCFWSRSQL